MVSKYIYIDNCVWYFLRFWQKRFLCCCTSSGFGTILLPMPEEVPKKQKMLPKPDEVPKKKSCPIFRPGDLQDMKIFVFLVFFGTSSGFSKNSFVVFVTSSGFGTILLPKPEEVPKKHKMLPKPEELPKNKKKTRFSYLQAWVPPRHETLFLFLGL